MKLFLKGIVIGIGGIAPGLSGSVLMVIFGIYHKVVHAIGNIFKNFKKNLMFLIPLFIGVGIGIVLFSKLVDYLLNAYETYTRFAFFGLIVGTIPLFWREVRKEGFSNKYYGYILVSLIIGILIFYVKKDIFEPIKNPNIFQSVFLGIAVAGSSIVPGVDSAAILSSLGLYELYVSSVAHLNMSILIPAGFGLGIGVLGISYLMSKLLAKYYTATFSIIFGLFISIVPNVLKANINIGFNMQGFLSILFMILGFCFSIYFGRIEENVEKLKEDN